MPRNEELNQEKNNLHPPVKIRFCPLSMLDTQPYVRRWIDLWHDELIAIRKGKEVVVFSSVCPHFGGPLDPKADLRIGCPWHGWEFDLDSGRCLTFDIRTCLRFYAYEITAGWLSVLISENSISGENS